jgi:hypothetical protein
MANPDTAKQDVQTTVTHPYETVPMLLATGQGRSGTTVLTKALAEHHQVYSNRVESNVMHDVLDAGHRSSSMTSRISQMVVPRAEHDLVFRRMLFALLFPTDGWDQDELPAAVSTFSAMDIGPAEFAVESFSGIHFANIIRNGIEVVSSRMAHRVMGSQTFENQCTAWAAGRRMVQWGEGRDDFTLIRHEDLLDETACRDTFDHLFQRSGLPHDKSSADYVLKFRRNQTHYEHESDEDKKDLTKRLNRWEVWTKEQRKMFVDICGETMEFYGYSIPAF